MTSIVTVDWPPGGSVPSDQTRAASSSPDAWLRGLAGGVVVTSAVPWGTASRSTTSCAVALPMLRTMIS